MTTMTEVLDSVTWHIHYTANANTHGINLIMDSVFNKLVWYKTLAFWREDAAKVEILKRFLKKFPQIKTIKDIFRYIDSDNLRIGGDAEVVLRCTAIVPGSRFYQELVNRNLIKKINALPNEVYEKFHNNMHKKFKKLLSKKLSESFPYIYFRIIKTDPICSSNEEHFIGMDTLIPVEKILVVYDSAIRETVDGISEIAKLTKEQL